MKQIQPGDAIYLCCCVLTQYRGMRLGFDRTFFIGEISEESRKLYDIMLESQNAALAVIKPGAICEDVHKACLAVLEKHGLQPGYRTGRSTGFASLENPQFKLGDKTVIQEGMCFIVDGGVVGEGGVEGDGKGPRGVVRIGDTIVVTHTGWEYLTEYEKGPIVIPVGDENGKQDRQVCCGRESR